MFGPLLPRGLARLTCCLVCVCFVLLWVLVRCLFRLCWFVSFCGKSTCQTAAFLVYFKSAHPRVPSGLGGELWVKTVGTWEKPDDTCNLFVFFCVCLSFCKISKDAPKLVVFKGYYNFSMLIDIGST